MSRRILIIYNPISGKKRILPIWRKLKRLLPDFQCEHLNIRSERDRLSSTLAECGCAVIIGGDCTVRTVIQAIAGSGEKIPIAIIPSGSGNLLARSLHLPASLHAAERIIRGNVAVPIDVARLDSGEYFAAA